jgi:hypothetical protein
MYLYMHGLDQDGLVLDFTILEIIYFLFKNNSKVIYRWQPVYKLYVPLANETWVT